MSATNTKDQQSRFERSIVRTNQELAAAQAATVRWFWIVAAIAIAEAGFIIILMIMLLQEGAL